MPFCPGAWEQGRTLAATWGSGCPGLSCEGPLPDPQALSAPPRPPDRMFPCPQVVAVYNLTLQVADMSGDGLTATASAIITLEDINDNAPGFTGDEVLPSSPPLLGTALPSAGSWQGHGTLWRDGRLGDLEKHG